MNMNILLFLKTPAPAVSHEKSTDDRDRSGDTVFTCTTEVVRTIIQLNRESNFADPMTLVQLIKV